MKTQQQYARTLYGIETRLDGDPAIQIGELWNRFLSEEIADDIPSRLDDSIIALYCDYEAGHPKPYTFFLGCEVLDVCSAAEGFSIRYTPVGEYVEFRVTDDMPQAAIQKWQQIREMDLPRSYVADFEIHNPSSPNEVSIHVGVGTFNDQAGD
ncbi:MAG: effector binding domain-containing protein [Planctomycetaceae bacterium]